jgi:hypothetical protein
MFSVESVIAIAGHKSVAKSLLNTQTLITSSVLIANLKCSYNYSLMPLLDRAILSAVSKAP